MNQEITNLFADAFVVVRAAGLPPHLETAAFEKALELLSRRTEIHSTASDRVIQTLPAVAATIDSSGSPTTRIAQKLGLDEVVVREVFEPQDDGGIELIISPSRLSEKKRPATHQLAVLIAGSRQLGGLEEWTAAKHIRDACQNFGKFDGSNFSDYLKELDRFFGFKGKGPSREVKLNRAGWGELKSIIVSLTSPQ